LKVTIPKKQTTKGTIAKLNEFSRYLLHPSDAESTSFIDRSTISPTTTIAPYCGNPGVVIIVIALEERALEEIMFEEILLNNILTPCKCSTTE